LIPEKRNGESEFFSYDAGRESPLSDGSGKVQETRNMTGNRPEVIIFLNFQSLAAC